MSTHPLLDNELEERKTYILKFHEDKRGSNRVFIANRSVSKTGYFGLGKRMVTWYEFTSALENAHIFCGHKYDVLDTMDLPNYRRGDQVEINKRKKEIIENTHFIEADEIMCNELFKSSMEETNKKLKSIYEDLCSDIKTMYNSRWQDLYNSINDLWYRRRRYLKAQRFKLVQWYLEYDKGTLQSNTILVAIFMKDYLAYKVQSGAAKPFNPTNLKLLVKECINDSIIGKKNKL